MNDWKEFNIITHLLVIFKCFLIFVNWNWKVATDFVGMAMNIYKNINELWAYKNSAGSWFDHPQTTGPSSS